MSTGMHSTVAKPTDEAAKTPEELKQLWEEKANPDLADKQKMLQTISFKLGDFDDELRTFRAIGSTPLQDRQGDSIEQAGWVLDNFIKNPVVPWAHIYYELPVARAIEVGVQDGNLVFTYQAPPEGLYPFADTVWQMYRHQFMFAFSVGFIPLEYEGNWEDGYNFTKCELLEISAVPVPANAGALVLAQKMGVMDNKQAKSMINKVEDALKQLKKANSVDTPKHQKDLGAAEEPVVVEKTTEVTEELGDHKVTTKTTEKTATAEASDTKVTIIDKDELKSMLGDIIKELNAAETEAKAANDAKENDEKASSSSTQDSKGLTNNDNMLENDNMTEQKSGAKLSSSSKAKIKAVMDGLEAMKSMADDHIKALTALHGSDNAADDGEDTDSAKGADAAKVKAVEDETTEVNDTKEVEGEAKAADDSSEEGADQESDQDDKDKDTVSDADQDDKAKVEEAGEEVAEDAAEAVADKDKKATDDTKSVENNDDDLIDPDNLSDEDVVRLTAAVQAELDKDKE